MRVAHARCRVGAQILNISGGTTGSRDIIWSWLDDSTKLREMAGKRESLWAAYGILK